MNDAEKTTEQDIESVDNEPRPVEVPQIVIEQGLRLSDSKLWQLQRQYFEDKGVRSFDEVPFYITSNPSIAHSYAMVIMRFISEKIIQNQYDTASPFYILELGAGCGQFSYYCLQAMEQLRKNYRLESVNICYVMSDISKQMLNFWQNQPQFTPFLQAGILDFAWFDVEDTQTITLINQDITLDRSTLKNPLSVVSNYVFNTLAQDVFQVDKGQLNEARVALNVAQDKVTKNINNTELADINLDFSYHAIDMNYYEDENFDALLAQYQQALKRAHVLLPVAALRIISHLQMLANDQMLLLVTDQGHTSLLELEGRNAPTLIAQGAAALSVNFHALAAFIKDIGGDSFHQDAREGIKTSVFVTGTTFSDLPLTRAAMDYCLNEFGPGDYFNFYQHLKVHDKKLELKTMISHLNMSKWDPRVLHVFLKHIVNELSASSTSPLLKDSVLAGIDTLIAHIYPLPGHYNSYFDVALVLQASHDYTRALQYYDKAASQDALDAKTLYNSGLCHYLLGEHEPALLAFRSANKRLRQRDTPVDEHEAHQKVKASVLEWIVLLEKKRAPIARIAS